MEIEWFDIVDENGQKLSQATREQCHDGSKRLHPVVHVHVFNSEKKLLLQKRKDDKDIQPGKWDTSVGGHIQAGESVENALKRETLEELGFPLNIENLHFIKQYIFESDVERELVYSYACLYDGPVRFQESEIDAVMFLTGDEIRALLAQGAATPNFAKEFELLQTTNLLTGKKKMSPL